MIYNLTLHGLGAFVRLENIARNTHKTRIGPTEAPWWVESARKWHSSIQQQQQRGVAVRKILIRGRIVARKHKGNKTKRLLMALAQCEGRSRGVTDERRPCVPYLLERWSREGDAYPGVSKNESGPYPSRAFKFQQWSVSVALLSLSLWKKNNKKKFPSTCGHYKGRPAAAAASGIISWWVLARVSPSSGSLIVTVIITGNAELLYIIFPFFLQHAWWF